MGLCFRITTNGEFTTLYSFDKTNGSSPFGTPLQVGDGGFYGTTEFGGAYNLGTVYHFRVPLPPSLGAPTAITNECGFPDLLTVTITNFDAGVLTSIWSINQQPVQTNTFQGQSGSEILGLYQLASLPRGTNLVTLASPMKREKRSPLPQQSLLSIPRRRPSLRRRLFRVCFGRPTASS